MCCVKYNSIFLINEIKRKMRININNSSKIERIFDHFKICVLFLFDAQVGQLSFESL